MSQHKDRRRVSKEHLALAVRKDFNAAAAHEQEIVTAFLYSIRNQGMTLLSQGGNAVVELRNLSLMLTFSDTKFRMRFTPSRPK